MCVCVCVCVCVFYLFSVSDVLEILRSHTLSESSLSLNLGQRDARYVAPFRVHLIDRHTQTRVCCFRAFDILYISEGSCEPRHEKTCLRGLRPGKPQNRPAHLQRQARGLRFCIYKLQILYYLSSENKGADQTRGCAG